MNFFHKMIYLGCLLIMSAAPSVANELYLKSTLDGNSQRVLGYLLETAWNDVCETNRIDTLNLDRLDSHEFHMTLSGFKTSIKGKQINKKDKDAIRFMPKLKNHMQNDIHLLSQIEFEITGVHANYGKWLVLELNPIIKKQRLNIEDQERILAIIPEKPHISLARVNKNLPHSEQHRRQLAYQLTELLSKTKKPLKVKFTRIEHQVSHQAQGVTTAKH